MVKQLIFFIFKSILKLSTLFNSFNVKLVIFNLIIIALLRFI